MVQMTQLQQKKLNKGDMNMSDNLLESLIDLGFDSCKALYNIVYVNNKEGWEILDNKFRGALSEKAREYYDLFKELFKYSSLDFQKNIYKYKFS